MGSKKAKRRGSVSDSLKSLFRGRQRHQDRDHSFLADSEIHDLSTPIDAPVPGTFGAAKMNKEANTTVASPSQRLPVIVPAIQQHIGEQLPMSEPQEAHFYEPPPERRPTGKGLRAKVSQWWTDKKMKRSPKSKG